GKASQLEVRQTLIVDIFLHTGDALVVDIHQADNMGSSRTAGIEAALLGTESDAGNAQIHDRLLLARRQLAAKPDEASVALQAIIGLLKIEIGQNRHQLLKRLVSVDDSARLGKQR